MPDGGPAGTGPRGVRARRICRYRRRRVEGPSVTTQATTRGRRVQCSISPRSPIAGIRFTHHHRGQALWRTRSWASHGAFLPLLRLMLPELVDFDLPEEGAFMYSSRWTSAIRCTRADHARTLGAGQMQFYTWWWWMRMWTCDYAQVTGGCSQRGLEVGRAARRKDRSTCSTIQPQRCGEPRSSTPHQEPAKGTPGSGPGSDVASLKIQLMSCGQPGTR